MPQRLTKAERLRLCGPDNDPADNGLGYQFCPGALAATSPAERDEAIIYQWQQNFQQEIAPLAVVRHGRAVKVDGQHGPATAWTITNMQRCGEPDYRDPTAQVAEANWPDACRNVLTWSQRVRGLKGVTAAEIDRGFREGFKVWSDALNVGFREEQENYPNTHFHERQANLGRGGTLARHLLAHNRCDSDTWGEYNTQVDWFYEMLLAVIAHELGHGLGLDHVPGPANLMNPSITQGAIDRGGKPIAGDLNEAVRKGYTLRTERPDDPPPPDDGETIPGRAMLFIGNDVFVGNKVNWTRTTT